MRRAEKGKVYLVGSGPGNPELLTMRAVRLLETADVVFHDDLVSDEVLGLVHRSALVTSVGKRFGQPKITQAGINALLIESARAEQSVVRLKSGDPLVFGRAAEELAALRGAGISFEVVPGVTAALAASAVLGFPYLDGNCFRRLSCETRARTFGQPCAHTLHQSSRGVDKLRSRRHQRIASS